MTASPFHSKAPRRTFREAAGQSRSEVPAGTESVIPPTLFQLPALPGNDPEQSNAVQNEVADTTHQQEVHASPAFDSGSAAQAPVFDVRYDDGHPGPNAPGLSRKPEPSNPVVSGVSTGNPSTAWGDAMVSTDEKPAFRVDGPQAPPNDRDPAPQATDPALRGKADSKPSDAARKTIVRGPLEKYGSGAIVAIALLLIASATWLMGQTKGIQRVDSLDIVDDGTEQPERLYAEVDRLAAAVGPSPTGSTAANTIHETPSELAGSAEVLTDEPVRTTLGKPEVAGNLDMVSPTLEAPRVESPADPELSDSMPGPFLADPNQSSATGPSVEPNLMPALEQGGAGSIGVGSQNYIDETLAESPAVSAITQPNAGQVGPLMTSTPAAISDWSRYFPADPSSVTTSAESASMTVTPADPMAAYQQYLNNGQYLSNGVPAPATPGSNVPAVGQPVAPEAYGTPGVGIPGGYPTTAGARTGSPSTVSGRTAVNPYGGTNLTR